MPNKNKKPKKASKPRPEDPNYFREVELPRRTREEINKKASGINMGSPLYGKISSACKAAAKRKFKVWPSAYASGWGVRCTKAGGPSNFGGKNKK
tara:strand:- start:272 stop:556 length:285 start_codon:yes stop_codon:yes gene_type:complete